jgi:flagellar hook-associated protein 3 FlgL
MFLRDIRRNLADITDLQHQISTGKRVNFPSDDPIGADRILRHTQELDKIDQYVRNLNDTDSLASSQDSLFDTLESVLMRVRDLAVRGNNEAPFTQNDLDPISQEVDQLIQMMWTQANQKFNGKYVFGGYQTDKIPFSMSNEIEYVASGLGAATDTLTMPATSTGNISKAITAADSITDIQVYNAGTGTWNSVGVPITSDPVNNQVTVAGGGNTFNNGDRICLIFNKDVIVTYNGDMGEKEVEIAEGMNVKTTFVGASSQASKQTTVFGTQSEDERKIRSVETFQLLFDLRDNLSKYDVSKAGGVNIINDLGQAITDIDGIRNRITDARAELGGRVNRMELAVNRHQAMKIENKQMLSNYEDVDMTEALSNLVLKQNIYQAALASGASIIQTTLLDFLR